ncbi:hypothetical protein ABL78_2442 [Leptomonas seymouri]|uniref:Uncharacterized protein n=1 Tax=Leptomonas seymouri TaxID=5684 RepID=A0A0N1PFB2_LEPSE|nr:hypothetical protein ABL78_2442 [Leptomonas seymouri]|eukprot:KPI88480.1 hypothetical protein ABL78_2442 [Leptomonas seymouri]
MACTASRRGGRYESAALPQRLAAARCGAGAATRVLCSAGLAIYPIAARPPVGGEGGASDYEGDAARPGAVSRNGCQSTGAAERLPRDGHDAVVGVGGEARAAL